MISVCAAAVCWRSFGCKAAFLCKGIKPDPASQEDCIAQELRVQLLRGRRRGQQARGETSMSRRLKCMVELSPVSASANVPEQHDVRPTHARSEGSGSAAACRTAQRRRASVSAIPCNLAVLTEALPAPVLPDQCAPRYQGACLAWSSRGPHLLRVAQVQLDQQRSSSDGRAASRCCRQPLLPPPARLPLPPRGLPWAPRLRHQRQ